MTSNKFKILSIFAVLSLLASACSFNFSTAKISDAYIAFDSDGAEATTVFGQDDVFYAIVDLSNAPDDTTVSVDWTAVNVEGFAPNTIIDHDSYTSGETQLYFSLIPDTFWELGQYRVDLYLNDKLNTSLDFQVQSAAKFSAAYMAFDVDGTQPTTVYGQDNVFYAIVVLSNAPDDTIVRAVWTAVNVEGFAPDTTIYDESYTSGDAQLYFYLAAPNTFWALGQYRVDLYLNDNFIISLDFQVQ
jgi:hypothetical protein